MSGRTAKSLRSELIAACMILGILALDLAANYRLLLGVEHEDRARKASKIYFVSSAQPGGPLTFLLPPLIIWAWAALMWRIIFERKAADLVQGGLFGIAITYFLTEVVPLEKSLQNLSSQALHDALLKVFWGHIVLTFTVCASIGLSFIARPPPSRTRLEVFPLSILLGILAIATTFYVHLFLDDTFPTVALDAIGHLMSETYLWDKLVAGLLAIAAFAVIGRLFTPARSLRDVLALVLMIFLGFMWLSISQRLATAAQDKKYPVSAHKANGAFFGVSALATVIAIVLQWGCVAHKDHKEKSH